MPSPAETPTTEMRQQVDRRARPTSFWSALRFNGRRKGFRRAGEAHNAYVDCPAPRVVVLLLAVLICSVLDAFFTLLFLERGGEEANPVMALVLAHGTIPFVALKMALTGIGVWFLAAHQHFPLAFKGLHILAGGYALLLFIHTALLLS
jgi:Domain of unknown function (DUF5658)